MRSIHGIHLVLLERSIITRLKNMSLDNPVTIPVALLTSPTLARDAAESVVSNNINFIRGRIENG
jgi:hypothetical protein